MEEQSCSTSKAIDSSNVGFQMLKKCGWKEGTGLGISEQGRLEPVQACVKKNKSGIGAEKIKSKQNVKLAPSGTLNNKKIESDFLQGKKRKKSISKRLRKLLEEDEKMKEREFQQAFFREFWPDNV